MVHGLRVAPSKIVTLRIKGAGTAGMIGVSELILIDVLVVILLYLTI